MVKYRFSLFKKMFLFSCLILFSVFIPVFYAGYFYLYKIGPQADSQILYDFLGIISIIFGLGLLGAFFAVKKFLALINQDFDVIRNTATIRTSALKTPCIDEFDELIKLFQIMDEKIKTAQVFEQKTAYDFEKRIKLRTLELEKANDELNRIQKELEKIVNKRTIQLKRLNEHLIYSEENERKAIASDLHDSVTQTLAMSISKIKNMQESGNTLVPGNLIEIQGYLEQAVREIRSLIYQLSPPVLDDFDIDIALGFLIEQVNSQHQADFQYLNNIDCAISLTQGLKITLYRAVSEFITNILKHSGVKTGQIVILIETDILIITVEDKGKGFNMDEAKNSETVGFGLNSLSERIENFGGKIQIDSSPGIGTKIILTVPVRPDKEN